MFMYKPMSTQTLSSKRTRKYIASINKMRRGALTIPAEIRDAADWRNGQFFEIVFDKKKKRLYIQPQPFTDDNTFAELSTHGEALLNQALQEVKNEETKAFDNVEDLIKDLRS